MTTGVEVYDETTGAILLLSSSMAGWFCRTSGRGTTVARSGLGNTTTSKAVIPINSMGYSVPLVAISIDSGYAAARGPNAANSDIQYASNAPIGTGFSYYVFDYGPALPARYQGLETFDDSGNRTFSSEFWPLKALANIYSVTSATYSGKTLAIACLSAGGHRIAGEIQYYMGGIQVMPGDDYDRTGYQNDGKLYGGYISGGGNTATFSEVSFDDVFVGPTLGDITVPTDWDIASPVLAIDVTNIPSSTTFF